MQNSNELRPSISFDDNPGAKMTTVHMSRTSRAYLVQENELTGLSVISGGLALSGSIFSVAVSMILTAFWDMKFSQGNLSFAQEWLTVSFVLAACSLVGSVCLYSS